jgi:hypothetical protein
MRTLKRFFEMLKTAKDGQYKVQLLSRNDGLELYVARQGRFNVEGYVGFEPVARSLNSKLLRKAHDLSHSQVQTFLASIGHLKRYEVYVPECDAGRLDWALAERFALRKTIPAGFEQVRGVLSEIDVIWIARGGEAIEGLFEVEHSTTVYSGLLRFNDIRLTDPKVSRFSIVSNDKRRGLFARQLFRPTFRKSGLAELTSFLEYSNVLDWHMRLARGVRKSRLIGNSYTAARGIEGRATLAAPSVLLLLFVLVLWQTTEFEVFFASQHLKG